MGSMELVSQSWCGWNVPGASETLHLGERVTPVTLNPIAYSSDAGGRRPLEEEMRACPAGWNAQASCGPPLHPSAPRGKPRLYLKSLVSFPAGLLAPSD